MRYHIDTIPVWDAYKVQSECPLCDLAKTLEQGYLESFLGASVMEPAIRIEVNQKGFCGPHFAQMIQMKNRLGLALMVHTHMKEKMQAISDAPTRGNSLLHPKKAVRFFPAKKAVSPVSTSCILCERLSDSMNRYLYTVLHLWKTDPEFIKVFQKSKGHCLVHHEKLVAMATEALDTEKANVFATMLTNVQNDNMARIEKELEWFTLKFDYRNADKPWGESKDALERAINKLCGKYV